MIYTAILLHNTNDLQLVVWEIVAIHTRKSDDQWKPVIAIISF